MFFLLVLRVVRYGSLRRADHSSRGGVQNVACLTVIVHRRRVEAHQGLSRNGKKNNLGS